MTRSVALAVLLFAGSLDGSAAISLASAAPQQHDVQMPDTWKVSYNNARHRARHHARSADRLADGSYYYLDRPYYYQPAPYVPFNYGYSFWPFRPFNPAKY
jgi:hypothetical protein